MLRDGEQAREGTDVKMTDHYGAASMTTQNRFILRFLVGSVHSTNSVEQEGDRRMLKTFWCDPNISVIDRKALETSCSRRLQASTSGCKQ